MRKGVKIGAVVALVVALTSCSNSTDTTAPSTEPVGFANVETDTTPTPEPLVAETPTVNDPNEELFVSETRGRLTSATQIPNATDQQLIDAGWAACEWIASGQSTDDMTVIEGETRLTEADYYQDSQAIAVAAVMHLCHDVRD